MITFYSGTPGSGKSLHAAKVIYDRLRYAKKAVICSFPVDLDYISKNGKRKLGDFYYVPSAEMNAQFFYDYALEHHVHGTEHQTLVVIDECQTIFNPREFSRKDRLDWITFFAEHRHYGFDFILISQFDMLVDKQIRNQFEFDVKHRKLNNFGFTRFIPFPVFVAVPYWFCIRKKVTQEFFIYHKRYARIYDSFALRSAGLADKRTGVDVPPALVG